MLGILQRSFSRGTERPLKPIIPECFKKWLWPARHGLHADLGALPNAVGLQELGRGENLDIVANDALDVDDGDVLHEIKAVIHVGSGDRDRARVEELRCPTNNREQIFGGRAPNSLLSNHVLYIKLGVS